MVLLTHLCDRDTTLYAPEKAAAIFTEKGEPRRNVGKMRVINCEIIGFRFINLGPLTAEQLRKQGINASYIQPPDASSRMAEGNFECSSTRWFSKRPLLYYEALPKFICEHPWWSPSELLPLGNETWDELTDKIAATHPDVVDTIMEYYHDV